VEGSGHGLMLRYYPGICIEGLRKTMKRFFLGSLMDTQLAKTFS
jgi:hypothetical protein